MAKRRLQRGDEAARRFLGVAAALRSPHDHPRDLGRAGRRTAGRKCRLRCSRRLTGDARPQHPVAPYLLAARRAACRKPGIASGQSSRRQRRASGELMQTAVIQQRCEFGGMSRAQRFQAEPVSTPAAVKVDHPLTIAADQPSASRPSFAELADAILRSRKSCWAGTVLRRRLLAQAGISLSDDLALRARKPPWMMCWTLPQRPGPLCASFAAGHCQRRPSCSATDCPAPSGRNADSGRGEYCPVGGGGEARSSPFWVSWALRQRGVV